MRTTRLIAGTVTAGLLGLAPIAVAAPSHATDNLTTTITLEISYGEPSVTYGEDLSLTSQVDASDGLSPYNDADTVTLWAMPAGTTTWTPIETQPGTGYISWTDFKPQMNTAYKATYSGGTAANTSADNYAASESAPLGVTVARKITYPKSGFVIKGKVTPDYGKKKIVIQASKKQNKGFKKFKTIKTKANGKYKVTLPKRGGTWYWSFVVKGDSRYKANGFVWRTTVY
ncbi:hypothetical protein J2X46_001419 [Nocardioides sp. BE266]|uniref:hypothetical protein n=1 Tax=Nocardioides sp. BE266 TaxID=2817725 RepID=UPI002855102D|nr:hypothetical protein [Nocardioides sp. BE266]MDR7252443.1 hypothetical protein [Nocardioides sp. BE266]